MTLPAKNWKNKRGTGGRACKCGTWKQHWINLSTEEWPEKCSVYGCSKKPTLGGHIIHSTVSGEWIAPICDSCNKTESEFDLEGGVYLASANKAETCEQ